MQKCSLITVLSLSVLMLAGCTTTYTMTTRTGEIIETQGKPEVDTATGMTKYADAYGYHRVIKTSEIVRRQKAHRSWTGNALKQLGGRVQYGYRTVSVPELNRAPV